MEHFERIWRRGPTGKAILVLIGFLVLAIVVGIPAGIIVLLTQPGDHSTVAMQGTPTTLPVQATATGTLPLVSPPLTPTTSTAVQTPTVAPTSTAKAELLVQLTITDTNDYVNIRSGPSLTSTIVSRLNRGQTATVIGRNADSSWWFIDMNSTRGWVYGLLVILSGDRNSVPVSQATSPPQ